MNFKIAFASSFIIHIFLVWGLLVPGDDFSITLNLRQGLSSMALQGAVNNANSDPEGEKKGTALNDVDILISPAGYYVINSRETPGDSLRKDNKKNYLNSIESIGAISKAANSNAVNDPPVYPYIAKRLRYQGRVILSIEVLTTGKTGSVAVIKTSGHEILDLAALDAAKKWVFFNPGEMLLSGPVTIRKNIDFILQSYLKPTAGR